MLTSSHHNTVRQGLLNQTMSCLDQDKPLYLKQPSSDSSITHKPAVQPLHGLKLASHAVLEKAQQCGRLKCAKCGRSRMFFCYTCYSLVGVSQQEIPSIKVSRSLGLTWLFLCIRYAHWHQGVHFVWVYNRFIFIKQPVIIEFWKKLLFWPHFCYFTYYYIRSIMTYLCHKLD